jgi:LmbE family N-acetylglucosaminyl deacetylase
MSRTVTTGTPERAWTSWKQLASLPALSLDGCPGALMVAPHPDDEVLGAGGTLADLHARGVAVSVLALTDGEASHPHAPVEPSELGRRRADETTRAVQTLLGEAPIARVRLPDGGLAACEEAVEQEVEQHLTPGMWCFAPFRRDGHPDHEAAARATARACERRGARLIEYPIWMWHWTEPGAVAVPWDRARCVSLSPTTQMRKRRAIGTFSSQIARICPGAGGEAVLPPAVLEHFQRSYEVLFT